MLKYTLLYFLVNAVQCALGLTYWVDITCGSRLWAVEREFREMAARSIVRLHKSQDSNQQEAFRRIFNETSSHAPSVKEVTRIQDGIGAFTKTMDRRSSDVRIYCDNDDYGPGKRWIPVPDSRRSKLLPFFKKNSQRTPGHDQELYDHINGIRMSTRGGIGCQDLNAQGVMDTFAETFTKLSKDKKYKQENKQRSSITMCDLVMNGRVKTFDDLPTHADISAHNPRNRPETELLNHFDAIVSMTMLHEFTHIRHYKTIDLAYRWGDIQTLSNEKALKNADSYAYFGLLAKLADRFFILHHDAKEADKGKVKHSPNYIQKRRTWLDVVLPIGRRGMHSRHFSSP